MVDGVTVIVELREVPAESVPATPSVVRAVRQRSGTAPAQEAGTHETPPSLESLGVYRGRGTYSATAELTGVDELLLVGASDFVDLSIDGQVHPTIAGFGATRRVDVRAASGRSAIRATVEIWGHANFDDSRLPCAPAGRAARPRHGVDGAERSGISMPRGPWTVIGLVSRLRSDRSAAGAARGSAYRSRIRAVSTCRAWRPSTCAASTSRSV